MPVSTITPVAINESTWTLVASGATYTEVGVQLGDAPYPVYVALAGSLPAPTSDNYIILEASRDKSFVAELDASSNLYARSAEGNALLRCYARTA